MTLSPFHHKTIGEIHFLILQTLIKCVSRQTEIIRVQTPIKRENIGNHDDRLENFPPPKIVWANSLIKGR